MDSPFKFLDIYTREDRDIFFGRDREIDELYHRIFESKILLVYGISGTGKSSLVHCGLANKFQETDWFPINVRRGKNLPESMLAAMKELAHTPIKQDTLTPKAFLKSLRSLFLDYYKPIHFIFDQFEELFIFGSTAEKSDFIEIIKELSESDLHCRFVFVMREEYLAGVTEFEKHITHFLANRVRIEKMSPANAKLTIEGPCRVFNIPVEKGFSDKLIERLTNADSEIELTYLQVFLDKIYRLAKTSSKTGKTEFKVEYLNKVESVTDVLGSFLDEQVEQLSVPDNALAVLKSFISIKGTRRQMALDDVENFSKTIGKHLTPVDLQPLIQKLIQLRILRDKDQNNRYELRHDALAAVINKKISVLERDIIEIRHFLENGYIIFEKRGKLLAKEDLKYIAPYEDKLFLGQGIKDFIAKSKRDLHKHSQRIRNYKIAVITSLIIVLSGFTIWALSEKNKANHLYIKSKASSFNYLSKQVVEQDPNIALRLAEYAFNLDSNNYDIKTNLKNIYYNNSFYLKRAIAQDGHLIKAISADGLRLLISEGNRLYLTDIKGNNLQKFSGHNQEIIAATFSPDGSLIITGSYDKTARLWDLQGNPLHILRGSGGEVGQVAFSPDGRLLLTSSWDNTSHLWDLNGKLLRTFTDKYLTAISPDGHTLLGHQDRVPFICDMQGNVLTVFDGHTNAITTLAFSPDGNTILSGSRDMTIRLWNKDGRTQTVFREHGSAISSAAFSDNGNLIASSCKTGFFVWHKNGAIQRNFKTNEQISSISFDKVNEEIHATTASGNLFILNNSGSLIDISEEMDEQIRFIKFSGDGKLIIAGSLAEVGVWDIGGQLVRGYRSSMGGSANQIIAGDFLNNSQVLLLYSDNVLRTWDLDGNIINQWPVQPATQIAVPPSGAYILTNDFNNSARLYDTEGHLLKTFEGHTGRVISLAFCSNSKMILTGSMDHKARLWNLEGEMLAISTGHSGPVNKVSFANNNQILYTASTSSTETFADFRGNTKLLGNYIANDNSVRSWDIQGNQLQINRIMNEKIRSVDFHAGGDFYLIGFENSFVKLFNNRGYELQTLNDGVQASGAIAISPDGNMLATTDTRVYLRKNMMSYQVFHDKNNYQQLSFTDKLSYNITSFDDLKRNFNEAELREAAEYYVESSDFIGRDKRISYLTNALDLYLRLNNQSKHPEYLFRIFEINLALNQTQQQADVLIKINRFAEELSSFNKTDDLITIGRFFGKMADHTHNHQLKRAYLNKAALFYEKINPSPDDQSLMEETANVYQDLTFSSLVNGDYADAIDFSGKGLEIRNSLTLQAYIVLGYLFDGQNDKAKDIFRSFNHDMIQGIRFKQEARNKVDEIETAGSAFQNMNTLRAIIDNF